MCQYSAVNGSPTNWHYEHLTKLANSKWNANDRVNSS